MKTIQIFTLFLVAVLLLSFSESKQTEKWQKLFDGKSLAGWDKYIGPDLDDKGKPLTGTPIGLNNDPKQVFTVVNQEGENMIRISGENWGAITTKDNYENYHLHLQFKWGKLTWGQKKGKKMDSGLLYYSTGKYGADYGAWMRSQEFQIEEGNCGDYWGVAGGIADIPVIKRADTAYVYSKEGLMTTFKEGTKVGRRCIKNGDAEKPSGEWNSIDLYCLGNTSIHVVNGKVMMVLYHNRQLDNGQEIPSAKGKIQIQSEGAEVFYKDIKLTNINKLPAQLVN